MKAGQNIMDNEILNFTERLIPISDFSKGKTSRIFDDVKNNNTEYIVLKNNQPTAMVISLDSYRELVAKASKKQKTLRTLYRNLVLQKKKFLKIWMMWRLNNVEC